MSTGSPVRPSAGWLTVANLIVAVVWLLLGVAGVGVSLLSVHAWHAVVPLLLVAAGGLTGLAASRRLAATSGHRPQGAAWALFAAAVCAFGYVAAALGLKFGDLQAADPGTVVFVVVPGCLAVLPLGELLSLSLRGSGQER